MASPYTQCRSRFAGSGLGATMLATPDGSRPSDEDVFWFGGWFA